MSFWQCPRAYPGSTIAILGGGPSLTLDQVRQVTDAGLVRIAANNAYQIDPGAAMLAWGDPAWYLQHAPKLAQHSAPYKVSWRDAPALRTVSPLRIGHRNAPPYLDRNPFFVCGENAGHAAINLAVHLGAKRIILLGFDMTTKGGNNWHAQHEKSAPEDRYRKVFVPQLVGAASELTALGIDVVNCSSTSALDCFPKVELGKVLIEWEERQPA